MRVAILTHPDPATTGRYFERAALADGDQLIAISSEEDGGRLGPDDFLLAVDPFYSPWPAWLKDAPCKTAAYLIDVHQNLELRVAAGRFFDCVFAAQKDYLPEIDHPHKVWLPLAGDPDIHFCPDTVRSVDVGFVGKMGLEGSERRNTLLHVLSQFDTNDFLRRYTPREMGRIYSASKIVFNKSINRDLNMRAFEAWAAGALLVTDRIGNGLSEVATEGVHYIGYDTDDEAVEAIRYYLSDDGRREQIASAGQAHLNAHHTYLQRWRQVKREIAGMALRGPARLQSPITVHRWNSEMLAQTGAPPREALALLRRPGLSPASLWNTLIAVARFTSRRVRGLLASKVAYVTAPTYRSNAIWMFVQAIAQRLVGAASTVVLARLMSPAGLGAYSITSTTANTGYGILRFGIDAGAHVLAAGDDAEKSETLGDTLSAALVAFLLIGLAGALSCAALADVVATEIFHSPQALPYVRVAGALLLGQVIAQAAYTIFAGLHQFTPYVRVMLLGAPALAGAAIVGALWSGPLGAAVFAALAQIALSLVLLWSSLRTARALGVRIGLRLKSGSLASILQLGFPFYLAGLVYIPADYLIQGLMVRGHGFGSLGDLRVVLAITTIVSFLPNAIGGPMISAFSRAHQGPDGIGDVFWRTMRVVWAVALAASLLLGIVWPLLVGVFGAEYQQARSIGFVALAYAVAMCLRNVWSNRLLSSRRRTLLMGVNVTEAAVFTVVALLVVPRLGLAGYLMAQVAGASAPLLGAVVAAALSARRDELRTCLAGGALSVLGLALVAWFNLGAAPLSFRLAVATFGGVALAAVWSLTMVERAERRALIAALKTTVGGQDR